MAALTQDDERASAGREARELVLDAYASFSPELGDLVRQFFDERWIDAPGARAASAAARSAPTRCRRVHPYVMLNWTSRRRDVLTLAHELGHGVHAALARAAGRLPAGHAADARRDRVGVRRGARVRPPARRRRRPPSRGSSLLAEAIEGQIATVFRQIAMNRFEDALHTARRGEGELAVERIGELWATSQDGACSATRSRSPTATGRGGATSPTSSTRRATSTRTPTASCSRCRSTAATRRRARASCPRTSTCCARAARAAPRSSAQIVGIDLADPGFWDAGLDLVERQLEAAEAAAREARGVQA